jgi:hypothetical protein
MSAQESQDEMNAKMATHPKPQYNPLCDDILAFYRKNGSFPRIEQVIAEKGASIPIDFIHNCYLLAVKQMTGEKHKLKLSVTTLEISHGAGGYGHRVWFPAKDEPAVHYILKKFSTWNGPDAKRPNPHHATITDLGYEFDTAGLREALALII